MKNDVPGRNLLSINAFVRVVVRTNSGARERDTGEQAACSRVGQNLRAQCDVRFCLIKMDSESKLGIVLLGLGFRSGSEAGAIVHRPPASSSF